MTHYTIRENPKGVGFYQDNQCIIIISPGTESIQKKTGMYNKQDFLVNRTKREQFNAAVQRWETEGVLPKYEIPVGKKDYYMVYDLSGVHLQM